MRDCTVGLPRAPVESWTSAEQWVVRHWLVVWITTRAAIAALTAGSPRLLGPPGNADVVYTYYTWHLQMLLGRVPWRDFDVEYPVGVLPLLALPGARVATYAASFLALALLADAAATVALRRVGHHRGLAAWLGLPLTLGPLFWGRFDVFVGVVLVGIALAALHGRHGVSAGLCILGGLLKLWPLLLLVPVLRATPPVHRRRVTVAALAGVASVLAVVELTGLSQGQMRMLRYHGDRGLETESFWALPLLVVSRMTDSIYIVPAFGSNDVRGVGADVLTTLSTLTLLIGVAAWLVWTLRRTRSDVARPLTLLVVVILVTGKVFSAQYVVWMLCAGVLLIDRETRPARLWVALGASGLGVQLSMSFFVPFSKVVSLTPLFALLHGSLLAYGLFALGQAALGAHEGAARSVGAGKSRDLCATQVNDLAQS